MNIAVIGGSAGGLITGILLAKAGHDVAVLERDEEGPPEDDEAAWDLWHRAGITQIRQPHGFLGRTRQIIQEEIPELWREIENAVTYTVRMADGAPDPAAVDEETASRLSVEVMRRTTFQRLLELSAGEQAGLEVRRGVAVKGLLSRPGDGVPVVRGVATENGDVFADLVVDCGGRRTASPKWLRSLGTEVAEWGESDGFTYYSLWFRTHDDAYPPLQAGFFGGMAPGLLGIIFPGDAGVFGVALVGLGSDKALRSLREIEKFIAVAKALGPMAEWVDPDLSSPITSVIPMGAIQNRRLRFWTANGPSAYGIVNLGDSAMSTNPSLGRGVGVAAKAALELRRLLASTDDPATVTVEYDRVTEEKLTPWLWDAVDSDRGLRKAFSMAIGDADPNPPPSPRTVMTQSSLVDMECWERWTNVNQLFDLPSSCLEDEDLMARARRLIEDLRPTPPALSREGLVELLD